MHLLMPNCMQKINFIAKFILINLIPRFIPTYCFESLWVLLTTPILNDWINSLLLLTPYHMQKNWLHNSTHSWDKANSLFLITLGMSCLSDQPIWYLQLLWNTSHNQKFNFIPQVVRYCSLNNPLFWLVLMFWTITQELDFS